MIRRVATVFAVLGGVCLACPTWANGPTPFPDFQAKRIKPPKAGTKKRITVQIEPVEPPPVAHFEPDIAKPVSLEPQDRSIGRYASFWDKISPDLAQSGPGRLDAAIQVLAGGGTVKAPRLQSLQNIARDQARSILTSTVGTQVSPALVLAVIAVESSGNPKAESGAGARGLMQLMPATAERFGVNDSFEPGDNIAGGVRYLDWLMTEFDRDPILVLAGYNAGEGAVRNHNGVPPYPETRDYVPKVLAAFQVARGLCLTPPELISDGCVFAGLN